MDTNSNWKISQITLEDWVIYDESGPSDWNEAISRLRLAALREDYGYYYKEPPF